MKVSKLKTTSEVRILKSKLLLILILCPIFLFISCSKELTFKQIYHNTTARFNGYYNAGLRLDETIYNLEYQQKDNYDLILPVFKYGNPGSGKSNSGVLDEVIKKCSYVISEHPSSKWIDDCFMLIGKAYFYKEEYFEAIETFQYIYTKYKKTPIANEALLWLARSYIQSKQYSKAQAAIDQAINDKRFPKELEGELNAIYAQNLILSKTYNIAADKMVNAINRTKDKQTKNRYNFILGQLNSQLNRKKAANGNFYAVLDGNPPYEMAFQAKIQLAKLFDGKGGSGEAIKKEIRKMLKDDKNNTYQDQLYYELGMIAMKEKKVAEAKDLFVLSTQKSVANNNQKGLSFLELGNIYYAQPDFPIAKVYYDSTVIFLKKDHPQFDRVMNLKQSLDDIVKYTNIIYEEDSLYKLSSLSERELNKIIDKKLDEINRAKQAEQDRKNQAAQAVNFFDQQNPNNRQGQPTQNQGGTWYFYNPSQLGIGVSEFQTRWGTRVLEDNWRRKNKDAIALENNADGVTEVDSAELKDPRLAFRKRVPLTQGAKDTSILKQTDAYVKLAEVYTEKMSEYKESIRLLKELLKKFPENKFEEDALYKLVVLSDITGNDPDKKLYTDALKSKFPNSKYVKIIDGKPNAETEKEVNLAEAFYEDSYNRFKAGKINEIRERTPLFESQFPKNEFAGRHRYLYAITFLNELDTSKTIGELNRILKEFKDDIVTPLVQQQIARLNNPKGLLDSAAIKAAAEPKWPFNYNPEIIHYVAYFIPDAKEEARVTKEISNFNIKNFSLINLETSKYLFGEKGSVILVKEFSNAEKGKNYLSTLNFNEDVKGKLPPNTKVVLITQKNFVELSKKPDLSVYVEFFDKNYQ